MKAFANVNARDPKHAVQLLLEHRKAGRTAVLAGGGSDLLGMIKDQVVAPDTLVNLGTAKGLDAVADTSAGLAIGALATIDAIDRHPLIRSRYTALAEAAASVATPQIRNAGTIAGNVCQRPWCWYYRNNFNCLKAGGTTCFAAVGENQIHSLFGAGPCQIVSPSDIAPALVALDATFRLVGASRERTIPAAEFFTLPRLGPTRENVLNDEVLAGIDLPAPGATVRSTYVKVMDRAAWTHAVVAAAIVLDMDGEVCRSARVVLGGVAPTPWRVQKVEAMLAGQRVTPELSEHAGVAAVEGARPLAKNGYKVPMTRALVARTILALAARRI